MAQSETGHAKNVANFGDLISFCTGYGTKYNPTKASIKLTALNTLHTAASNSLEALNTVLAPWSSAVTAREIAFKPLSKLVTRVINALDASDVPKPVVEKARTIARKIQGRRTEPKSTPPAADAAANGEESPKNISASQMGFDNRVDSMDKLIKHLAGQPGYAPNETDLTVESLTTLLANMNAANKAVTDLIPSVSNARIERNRILYTPETGLVDIARDVKAYVKSVYGAVSPQFKQVSGLKFVKVDV